MMNTVSDNGDTVPRSFEEALAWLGAPPGDDPLRDLAPLRNHLAAIDALGLPALQHMKLLDLFQDRVERAAAAIKPLLLDATLPVPRRLRTIALGLMEVLGTLAEGYLRVIRQANPERLRNIKRTPARLCAQGLANLVQQYEVAQLVSMPPSADFWRCAQTLYALIPTGLPAEGPLPPEAVEAELGMKTILAFAAAQPEGFSPRETSFLVDYLKQQAAALEVGREGAITPEEYWLDDRRGLPPVAAARLAPPPHLLPLRFSCRKLGEIAQSHLKDLGTGDRPEALGIPKVAVLADYRNALARAEVRWSSPPTRKAHRRRQGCRVQICTHLGPLWEQLRGDSPGRTELPSSEWIIINESASGYAILHAAGEVDAIASGSAVGLRPSAAAPWNICIVRWARSDRAEHLELGLELVAASAAAVRIARDGADGAPIPALLLPPLPAVDRGECLLTARNCLRPGPFTLIAESGDRLQVSECRASQLALLTASVEVFEFERASVP